MDNIKNKIDFAAKYPDCVSKIELEFKPEAINNLIHTDLWPKAVNDNLIVNDDQPQKKRIRARSIIRSFITQDLNGKKFLDFGSGDDTCKDAAAEVNAKIAVAYDIKISKGVTADWNAVVGSGPYDIILMYDVIDHLVGADGSLINVDDIKYCMKTVKNVLADTGRIFVRCHPWASRHGTHCYLKENKAFIHYIDNSNDVIPTIKITAPVSTYEGAFSEAGLKIVNRTIIEQTVEPLLDAFRPTFQGHFGTANAWMYKKVMSFTFIDFELSR